VLVLYIIKLSVCLCVRNVCSAGNVLSREDDLNVCHDAAPRIVSLYACTHAQNYYLPLQHYSKTLESEKHPNVYCVWNNLPASGDRFVI